MTLPEELAAQKTVFEDAEDARKKQGLFSDMNKNTTRSLKNWRRAWGGVCRGRLRTILRLPRRGILGASTPQRSLSSCSSLARSAPTGSRTAFSDASTTT